MGIFKGISWVLGLSMLVQPAMAGTGDTEVLYENSSYTPLLTLIQSAQHSIDIEIYEIKDQQIQNGVIAAMDRGVKVRVIQESEAVQSGCGIFEPIDAKDSVDCQSQKSFMQKVRAKGGGYVPYAYQQFCPGSDSGSGRCLEHGKMVLVDSKAVLISTGNFNPSNLCDPNGSSSPLSVCNRDYSVLSTDANVVSVMETIFSSDFASKAYDLPRILKTAKAGKLTVSPYSLSPTIAFIRSARESILIENQYLKNPQMNNELIAAAQRGVKVFVIVSSICSFGPKDPKKDASEISQWTNTYTAFDHAGINTSIFSKQIQVDGKDGYLHAKAIVVDSKIAWVGSVNGSTQALTENREFGIFLTQQDQVTRLAQYMTADFQDAGAESWQDSLSCQKDR